MAKKTIDELPADNKQRLPADVIAIQHTGGGSTFKSTSTPCPPQTVFVESQAQLELTFPGLVIPSNTTVTIYFNVTPMVFTSPFLLGENTSVEFRSLETNTRLIWDGADDTAFIQLAVAGERVNDFRITDIEVIGSGGGPTLTNNLVDLEVNRAFEIDESVIAVFKNLGKVFCDQLISIRECVVQDIGVGFVFDDAGITNIGGLLFNQSLLNTATPTMVSIIQSTSDNPMRILIDRLESINLSNANDRLLYIDSDLNDGSNVAISNSSVVTSATSTSVFYQQGTSIDITTVSDQTPLARFTTAVADHGLSVGDIITLSGFTDVEYNQTFTVTAVPTTNTFETGVDFVTNVADGVIENQPVTISSINNLGVAQFVTEVDHGFVSGQVVRITGFTGTETYNETVQIQITGLDSFVSALVFDAGNTGTGKVDGTSIDSGDSRVAAVNNPGTSSSMTQSETSSNVDLTLAFTTIDTFEILANSSGALDTDFRKDPTTERFVVDTSTGILTYSGLEEIVSLITYSFDFSKPGGGSEDYELALFVNGAQITKTTVVLSGQTSTPTSVSFNGLITLQPLDTIELQAKDTTSGTSSVLIQNLKVLVLGQ